MCIETVYPVLNSPELLKKVKITYTYYYINDYKSKLKTQKIHVDVPTTIKLKYLEH